MANDHGLWVLWRRKIRPSIDLAANDMKLGQEVCGPLVVKLPKERFHLSAEDVPAANDEGVIADLIKREVRQMAEDLPRGGPLSLLKNGLQRCFRRQLAHAFPPIECIQG